MTATEAAPVPGLTASHPFDAEAESYDRRFGLSPAGRLFRFRLAERVAARPGVGRRLLDIGCGTGEDAWWFAQGGFEVTAIDPSPAMIERARAKASPSSSAVGESPRFVSAGLENASTMNELFDVVTSNFGALNCIPIERWRDALAPLVRSGGRLVVVLLGARPLPEALGKGLAAWRNRRAGRARVGGEAIPVYYAGPAAIAAALAPVFRLCGSETLGCLTPPPGSSQWPTRHPLAFGTLAVVEWMIGGSRTLCDYSDHFLLEFERVSEGTRR